VILDIYVDIYLVVLPQSSEFLQEQLTSHNGRHLSLLGIYTISPKTVIWILGLHFPDDLKCLLLELEHSFLWDHNEIEGI